MGNPEFVLIQPGPDGKVSVCYFVLKKVIHPIQKLEIERVINMLRNGEADVRSVLYEFQLVHTQGFLSC